MRIHHAKLPLAAAIVAGLSSFAHADKPQTFTLDQVTVAATLSEQNLDEVASSVAVVNSDAINNSLSTNIKEALRYQPGISVRDTGRFGSGGFNIRGADENQVKIVIDGVDQAKSFTPGGDFQRANRIFFDVESLKQIEVVKGPSSSLYGSSAIGGVVAMTTKDAADFLKAEGDDTAGSLKAGYDGKTQGQHTTASIANRSGKLESLLIYTHRSSDETETAGNVGGEGENRTQANPENNNSDNLLAKFEYQANDTHRIGLTFENFESSHSSELLSKNEYNDYSNYFGPGQFLEYADSRTEDELERTRISIDHQWQADLAAFDELQWSLSQQTTESHQKTLDTLNASAMVEQMFRLSSGPRVKDYSHEEKSLQLSATFSKALGKHQLTYGFSTEQTEFDNQINTLYPDGNAADEAGRYVPFVDASSYGVFIQDQVSLLNDQLTLTPSLRYDSFEATPETDARYTETLKAHDSSNLSFGLGGVYSINDQLSLFAQYAQGFKAPDLYDLYYERDGGNYFTMSNPDLEAEESDSFEFGVRLNNNLGQLEVTAFYNAYDNYIESRFVHDNAPYINGVTQAQNIAEATIKGIELRSTLFLDEALGAPLGLALETSIAYADGEGSNGDEGDTPLESIAPLTAVFGLNYTSPNNTWGSSLDWTLVAAKEQKDLADDTKMTTGGYGVVDVSAYFQPTEAITLRAGVYNLTDKKYWVYEDVRGLDADKAGLDRYSQSGRNLSVSANYAF